MGVVCVCGVRGSGAALSSKELTPFQMELRTTSAIRSLLPPLSKDATNPRTIDAIEKRKAPFCYMRRVKRKAEKYICHADTTFE